MVKTTLIVNSTVNTNEPDALAHYVKHAGAILKAHNGKLITKYKVVESITKNKMERAIMIMEFEDDTIIQALSDGEAYAQLIPYRDKAFSKISISFAEQV